MDPAARHFLWGILQRQVIATGAAAQAMLPPAPASLTPSKIFRHAAPNTFPMQSVRSCLDWHITAGAAADMQFL